MTGPDDDKDKTVISGFKEIFGAMGIPRPTGPPPPIWLQSA